MQLISWVYGLKKGDQGGLMAGVDSTVLLQPSEHKQGMCFHSRLQRTNTQTQQSYMQGWRSHRKGSVTKVNGFLELFL